MSCCYNITFPVFWVSQGSVTTLIRWGGWSLKRHIYRSFKNLTVKNALKSVDFCRGYKQKEVGSFYGPCVCCVIHISGQVLKLEQYDLLGWWYCWCTSHSKKKTCYFTSNYPHFHAMIFLKNLKRIGLYLANPFVGIGIALLINIISVQT